MPARGRHHARVLVVRRLPAPGRPRPARHPAHIREPEPLAGALPRRGHAPAHLLRGRRSRRRRGRATRPARRHPAAGWGGMVRRGIVWSVAAFGASKALSLISILVLARLLTPDQFGVVAAVAAYIALIELGSDLGMKPAIVYEQEEGISERIQTAFTVNLAHRGHAQRARRAARARGRRFLRRAATSAGLFRLGALNLLLTGLGNIHDGAAAARHELRAAHPPADRSRPRARRGLGRPRARRARRRRAGHRLPGRHRDLDGLAVDPHAAAPAAELSTARSRAA